MTEGTDRQTEGNATQEGGRGTTGGAQGANLLRRLRDEGFEASDEKFAVAMGRPVEEVTAWMEGREEPDEDAVMKAGGIAKERGIEP
jgi:hypothetical protein